ncbi:unnamed protein product [Arctia plantaginis]|uniref:Uncharacterized protein n=1 Tax=Arctia plantaginis TaxID=874455 RepID=A0A8S0ZZK2_ARCPL|nr:unnamed protein product [Arctia plantaginis]
MDTVQGAAYRVLQANVMRKKLATEEIIIEASNRKAAVVLIQEPYVGAARSMRNYRGVRIFQNNTPGEDKDPVVVRRTSKNEEGGHYQEASHQVRRIGSPKKGCGRVFAKQGRIRKRGENSPG